MSFQDVGVTKNGRLCPSQHATTSNTRGSFLGGMHRNHGNESSAAASGTRRAPPETTGLLYGKLRLVPSSSYESSSTKMSDDRTSLELSSCSSSASYSSAQSSSLTQSQSSNPNSPPRNITPDNNYNNSSLCNNNKSVATSRGLPGFSTTRRRRNRLAASSPAAHIRRWSALNNDCTTTTTPPGTIHNPSFGAKIQEWEFPMNAPMGVTNKPKQLRHHRHRRHRHRDVIHATGGDPLPSPTASTMVSHEPAVVTPPGSSWYPQQQRTRDTSKFAELSNEIKHFQKMVAQLEHLFPDNHQHAAAAAANVNDSPEVQWKCRILMRSAQDADRDIADKLYWYEKTLVVANGKSQEARTAQTACMKLHRDYRRVHNALEHTLVEHDRRQRADVARLTAIGATGGDSSYLLQTQQEEDFFERATREREEEINKIHYKMKQVNDIYQELAALVEGQQEQIDNVQENVQNAKGHVEGGLRHIEYARDRLCAMGGDGGFGTQCGGGVEDVADNDILEESPHPATNSRGRGSVPNVQTETKKETSSTFERLYPSSLGETEIFHWSMPFQTFHKDIKSIQKDIFGLGNDFASLRCALPESIECGSLADVNNCGGRNDNSIYDDSDSF